MSTPGPGRPSIYTEDVAEAICARLETGESLASVCRDPDMPGIRTVLRWADERQDFCDHYRRAREAQAEVLDDHIKELAAKSTDRESALAVKVQINAAIWRASKQAPRKFGDKIDVQVTPDFDLAQEIAARRLQTIEGRVGLSRHPVNGETRLLLPSLAGEAQ